MAVMKKYWNQFKWLGLMSEIDEKVNEVKTVILASGGTGGHIFPAEALAANLLKQDYRVILITDKRYKSSKTTPENLEVICVKSSSLQGGILRKSKALLLIAFGTLSAMRIIMKSRANVVVGFGAYPSFPAMIAGILLGKKTIIHEQNSVLGKVNKIIAKYVTKIALSFEKTKFVTDKFQEKITVTGNPVRPEIKKYAQLKPKEKGVNGAVNLFIVAGSLGSNFFSEHLTKIIISLPQEIKDKLFVTQQCRKEDIAEVENTYTQNNINFEVNSFFSDIAEKMYESDLIISRAGASSIFEIIAIKKPSILIPYKYALDNHQKVNADFLVEKNCAILCEEVNFDENQFKDLLIRLLSSNEELSKLQNNINQIAPQDASESLSFLVKEFYT